MEVPNKELIFVSRVKFNPFLYALGAGRMSDGWREDERTEERARVGHRSGRRTARSKTTSRDDGKLSFWLKIDRKSRYYVCYKMKLNIICQATIEGYFMPL